MLQLENLVKKVTRARRDEKDFAHKNPQIIENFLNELLKKIEYISEEEFQQLFCKVITLFVATHKLDFKTSVRTAFRIKVLIFLEK